MEKKKEEMEKKKEERGKKMRKGEVKGKTKCKLGKNSGKKATMGVEKRHVPRGGKISF
jgi:hypothetical protein